jgi:hypothetical protein
MRALVLLGAAAAVVGVAMFVVTDTVAYNAYEGSVSCSSCHSGFIEEGPLHDLHVGSSQMTSNCTLCHTSIGDNPNLGSSGADPNNGCNGCHTGPGLRAHHINAGAPADGNGFTCTSVCHSSDPTPAGEDVLPPYYSRTDVNVEDPCDGGTGGPGEDYSGDGEGLDNDGDLDYDANDQDCEGVQTKVLTWGQAKVLYR